MKIAFNISKLSYGGGQRIIIALITELVKRGYDVVCYTWNNSIVGEPFPCPLLSFGNEKNMHPLLRPIEKYLAVKRALKRDGIDVFVSFGNEPYVTAACRTEKVKQIFSLRVDPRELPKSRFQRMTYKYMLKSASGIVFQTKEVMDYYDESVHKKAIVIPNPIMDELPEPEAIKNHKISAVGRLMVQKNFDLLLDAAHECDLKDFCIHIYGSGELERHLREKVATYHLEDKVVFEGFVCKVVEHVKNSSIFVLSSNWEGMPNALIEAMAMGVACIATDVATGGSRFLIQDGENGLLIPVGDKDALARALQHLIDDESLRIRMGEQAISVRKRLEKEAIIDQWVRLLES